jgi:hypothetical protein
VLSSSIVASFYPVKGHGNAPSSQVACQELGPLDRGGLVLGLDIQVRINSGILSPDTHIQTQHEYSFVSMLSFASSLIDLAAGHESCRFLTFGFSDIITLDFLEISLLL